MRLPRQKFTRTCMCIIHERPVEFAHWFPPCLLHMRTIEKGRFLKKVKNVACSLTMAHNLLIKLFSTRTPHLLRRLVSMKQYPTSFIAPKSLSAMVCSSAEAYWCRCHKLLSVFQILFWWLSYYQNQNNRRSWYWEAATIPSLRRRASR